MEQITLYSISRLLHSAHRADTTLWTCGQATTRWPPQLLQVLSCLRLLNRVMPAIEHDTDFIWMVSAAGSVKHVWPTVAMVHHPNNSVIEQIVFDFMEHFLYFLSSCFCNYYSIFLEHCQGDSLDFLRWSQRTHREGSREIWTPSPWHLLL